MDNAVHDATTVAPGTDATEAIDATGAQVHGVDVVVVGAGLAGLCAATDLVARGVDVVVLEARDRVGGRLLTRTSATGERVELGGQWINPGNDRIADLVDGFGLQMIDTAPGTSAAVLGGESVTLPTASDDEGMSPFEVADLAQGLLRFRRLSERVEGHPEWAEANATWLSQPLQRWMHSNLRTAGGQSAFGRVIDKILPAGDAADEPADPAADAALGTALRAVKGQDLDSLAVVNSGVSQRRVVGGVAQVAERLADALGERVHLDSFVRRVARTDAGLLVVTVGGERYRAADVVVAVPPRVVGEIEFEPALPQWRTELVAEVPRGNVIKAALVYETPWWRQWGLSGQVGTEEGPMRVMGDNSDPASTRGVLAGYFEGPDASGIGRWSVTLREHAFTRAVEQVFGPGMPQPLEYLEVDWGGEPHTGGCHGAHFAPSVWSSAASALSASEGHVHFAGSEYATRGTGYMEGAVRSGQDVAASLLRARLAR